MSEYESYDYAAEINVRLRDLNERSKLLRDRILLIGRNLIDTKEKWGEQLARLKADVEIVKKDNKRIRNLLEKIEEKLDETPNRDEFEILKKQFKMFEPLNLVRMSDLKKMLKEKLDV